MNKIDFFLVRSNSGIQTAAELVQFEYVKDGYVSTLKRDQLAPISRYNLQSTSFTFLAKYNETALGTLTMVGDSELGFPLDNIFKDEIDGLRKENKKCAEISQLAIRRDAFEILEISQRKAQMLLLLPLFKLVFYCAKAKKIDTLCVTINPKHDSFYVALGFQALGEVKQYEAVSGAPALLRILNLNKILKKSENLIMREILTDPLEEDFFEIKEDNKDRPLFSLDIR